METQPNAPLEALRIRIDALELIKEAYQLKIEALELLNKDIQLIREVKNPENQNLPEAVTATASISSHRLEVKRGRGRPKRKNAETVIPIASGLPGIKRRRGRPKKLKSQNPILVEPAIIQQLPGTETLLKSIAKLYIPTETWLKGNLKIEGANSNTFKGLTGIMLCLFDYGSANISAFNEYIGGERATVNRLVGVLKKNKLITLVGTKKHGHYVLTTQGRSLYMQIAKPRY